MTEPIHYIAVGDDTTAPTASPFRPPAKLVGYWCPNCETFSPLTQSRQHVIRLDGATGDWFCVKYGCDNDSPVTPLYARSTR